MLGSEALEVAIGLLLVYLVLALVCTTVVEWIARILALRSDTLYAGIECLLDTDLARKLYAHPLISGYARETKLRPGFLTNRARPSYIPSHLFALTLFQIASTDAAAQAPAEATTAAGAAATSPTVTTPTTLAELRQAIARLPDGYAGVKNALLPLVDQATGAADELVAARENVEAWFDNAMERVSGQYTRKAQLITLAVALVLTVVVNADSFAIADALRRDPELRTAVANLAEQTVQDPAYQACLLATPVASPAAAPTPDGEPAPNPCDAALVSRLEDEVAGLGLPLGWSGWLAEENEAERDLGGWLAKVAGLLFTGFAVSLGAPFWFDLLKRFVNVRAAGKVPEPTATATHGTTEQAHG